MNYYVGNFKFHFTPIRVLFKVNLFDCMPKKNSFINSSLENGFEFDEHNFN